MATSSEQRLLTADEFLQIEFGPDMKAELDRGVIRMMAGGSREHARVQMNLYRFLGQSLRGSGCRPFGSDMAVRTRPDCVRYPDLTVDCAGEQPSDDQARELSNPQVIIEVLSPGTRGIDQGAKLDEYLALAGLHAIMLVDPEHERVRLIERNGQREWIERIIPREDDVRIATVGITIPYPEIFARD